MKLLNLFFLIFFINYNSFSKSDNSKNSSINLDYNNHNDFSTKTEQCDGIEFDFSKKYYYLPISSVAAGSLLFTSFLGGFIGSS